ncbi:light-inducible protein CPRF2-like [Vitis riparia]|uniref:light-inducible protein CPRF2-like n=1 Tax=Vitis riparia TaxID=96939 RepID=UPI00155AC47C|nr:light-inducible protein CPRF2-like [Vitis riparia]
MDGINKKDHFGLPRPPPPPPPRSRVDPSTQVLPPISSQHGRQHQLTVHSGGGNRPLPEGLNRSIIPHYQSQHPQNHPISAGGGTEVSSRTEPVTVPDATRGPQPDPNLDDRRLRRLLSNRISAQRSRLRRTNYINEMETQVKEFEAQIAQLSPEVVLIQRKKKLLQMDNELMKQKETKLQEHINLKNAETDAHQTELYHLRQLFELQQQQKQGWMAAWASGQEDYIANQGMYYQPWAEQQFAHPNMRQPSGSEKMENLGISMTKVDQIVASEAYQPGQERVADPGKYQPGGVE